MVYRTPPEQPPPAEPPLSLYLCSSCGLALSLAPRDNPGLRSGLWGPHTPCTSCGGTQPVEVALSGQLFLRTQLKAPCRACGFEYWLPGVPDGKTTCPHCGVIQRAPAASQTLGALRSYLNVVLRAQRGPLGDDRKRRVGQKDEDSWALYQERQEESFYFDAPTTDNLWYFDHKQQRPGRFMFSWSDRFFMQARLGVPLCPDCAQPLSLGRQAAELVATCAACGYSVPATQLAPGQAGPFVGLLQPAGQQAEVVSGPTTLALRCALCANPLTVEKGAPSASCPSCSAQCWIPARFWSVLAGEPRPAEPFWLIHQGLPEVLKEELQEKLSKLKQKELEQQKLAAFEQEFLSEPEKKKG